MDSHGSLGHQPSFDGRTLMRGTVLLVAMSLLVGACASQMGSIGGFRSSSDAAAIKAVFDTTAAGWNRGELPV